VKPEDPESIHKKEEELSFGERAKREAIAWIWIILAFLFIYGCIGQARVIPSESMENTLLVGDHLIMSRFGYDIGVPFMDLNWHIPLWRNPKRQQIVIFRALQLPGQPDLIKRVIGMPGDTVEIHDGDVFINGQKLNEPYTKMPDSTEPNPEHVPVWHVPPDNYFVMGDNRQDSNDSRFWGFMQRSELIGVPVMIYLSIQAPVAPGDYHTEAWEPGHLADRFEAYASAVIHPSHVRWSRLFHFF
jgi:signal peptidase I